MSAEKAKKDAASLLRNALPGPGKQTREHVRRAETLAKWIYEKFHVFPNGWRQKHLYWLRDRKLADYAAATRYHYFRSAVKLAHALGRPHIVPGGAWASPDGSVGGGGPGGRPAWLPPTARDEKGALGTAHDDAVAAVEALAEKARQDGDEAAQRRAEAALGALRGERHP